MFCLTLGSFRQSGSLPVLGLRLVAEGQEGEHVSDHPSHHHAVQRRHQPGYGVLALPARGPRPRGFHLPGAESARHREVDQGGTGELEDAALFST